MSSASVYSPRMYSNSGCGQPSPGVRVTNSGLRDAGAQLRQPVHELAVSGLHAVRIAGGDVAESRDGVRPALLDEVDVAREPIGVHGARIDRERRVDGLARAGIVARIEQHAGERREDLRVARPAGMRAAIRRGRAGEVALAGARGADVRVQLREARRAEAARAFGVGGRLRLLERVFGLRAARARRGATRRSGLRVASAVRARARAAG